MLRSMNISVPPGRTDELLTVFKDVEGVLGVQVQRGSGVLPPGDVITAQLTTSASHRILERLCARGLASGDDPLRMTTSELTSAFVPGHAARLVRERSDMSWEEMETTLGKESNMTLNGVMLMIAAGAFASIGLHTNALHYVIGAMVIAPGFEPIARIALGIVARGTAWTRGLRDLALGYLALMFGAGLAAALFVWLGGMSFGARPSYHTSYALVSYWTALTPSGLIVDFLAGGAGALLIATGRSVLTGGVMIVLSLIPAASLVGIGLFDGDLALVTSGAIRWALDVVLVFLASWLIFVWKRRSIYRRNSLL